MVLERYNANKSIDEIEVFTAADKRNMKHRDIIEGCIPSLISFYARRIPCGCLDQKLAESKIQPKTGACRYCSQRKERKAMMICTGCGNQQYCGRDCHVKDWVLGHRRNCKQETSPGDVEKVPKEQTLKESRSFAESLNKISKEEFGKIIDHLRTSCPGALRKKSDGQLQICVDDISPAVFWDLVVYSKVVQKYGMSRKKELGSDRDGSPRNQKTESE